ncbi:MAG: arylsulfatase [Aliiglaciecola sp.]
MNSVKLGLALTLSCAFLLPFSAFTKDSRPNIVVIMSDDAGYTDLGSFGGEIDTPSLDALAANGLKFTNLYSNARCSPTRATLLTGVDAAHVGFGGGVVGDWVRELPFAAHRARLKYEQPLVSELLEESGYQTMMVGKWHLGGSYMKDSAEMQEQWKETHPQQMQLTSKELELDYLALPPQRGFQQSFVFHSAQGNLFIRPDEAQPYYENNQKAKLDFNRQYKMHCYFDNAYSKKFYSGCHGKLGKAFYATDGITDRAIDMMIEASEQDAPFFMYVAYRAPHKPLQAPEELVQKYLKRYNDIDSIANKRHKNLVELGMFPAESPIRQANHMWANQTPKKIEQYRLKAALHAAMMEKIDDNVGRLVKSLEDTDELNNTLLIYLSDNGAAAHIGDLMNKPYVGVKALLWEGGARVHGIVHWPDIVEPGIVANDTVWVGDFTPTFLELTGIEFPKTYRGKPARQPDGRSIVPLLKGDSMPPPEAIFFNDKGQQSVIYQGKWKLLIEPGWYLQTLAKPGIAVELYDLEKDPGEVNNLVDKKPELVAKLIAMCEQWKRENGIVDYAEIIKMKPQDPF